MKPKKFHEIWRRRDHEIPRNWGIRFHEISNNLEIQEFPWNLVGSWSSGKLVDEVWNHEIPGMFTKLVNEWCPHLYEFGHRQVNNLGGITEFPWKFQEIHTTDAPLKARGYRWGNAKSTPQLARALLTNQNSSKVTRVVLHVIGFSRRTTLDPDHA